MSNLMNTLLHGMMNQSSLQSLSQRSGAEPSQVQSVVRSALPVLLQSMVQNAGSGQGEASLSQALDDHAQRSESLEQQVSNADLDDGSKILGHLLGGKQSAVEDQLAQRSGLQQGQIGTILAAMAPALLSSVGKQGVQSSAYAEGSQAQGGAGGLASSLMGMLSGGQSQGADLNVFDLAARGGKPAQPERQEDLGALGSLADLFTGK